MSRTIVPESVKQAYAESAKYFATPLQQFQFYDKYSRFNYELGRRETWVETVTRAVDFLRELSDNKLEEATYQRIYDGILNMRVMPSMRLLAMAGEAARRQNLAIYNCAAIAIDSIDSIVESLTISLAGCGVGYSVEQQFIQKLPRVAHNTDIRLHHEIEDTAEGWANALKIGLETWFSGGDITFDYHLIRPVGTPLKTKGGRASGYLPLQKMLNFIREKIKSHEGEWLRPLDVHDIMCVIGDAVVSGGVRRTSLISLFDYDDSEMRHCKSGDISQNQQRWNANNSAVWPDRHMTQTEIMRFMLDMFESGMGEPGIFTRSVANNTIPKRREKNDFLTNPCVTGDTWVMTNNGAKQVNQLLNTPHTTIVNGELWNTTSDGFWESGVKPVVKLTTKEGYTLRLTENHKVWAVTKLTRKTEKTDWVEAGKLKKGDLIKLHNHRSLSWDGEGTFDEGWLLGSLIGDGTFSKSTPRLGYWGDEKKFMAEKALEKVIDSTSSIYQPKIYTQESNDRNSIQSVGLRTLATKYGLKRGNKVVTKQIEKASSDFYCGFLQGFFDADGTMIGTQEKGLSVRLSQSVPSNLQAVQRMLLRLGIASTIYKNRRAEGFYSLPDGHGGLKEYNCKESSELVIANDNLQEFVKRINFSKPSKKDKLNERLSHYKRTPNREYFMATVEDIMPDGEEMVYDCSVPGVNRFDANGIVVSNCGEIILRKSGGLCNLSSVVCRSDDTFSSLTDKVQLATIIGTIQSMATNLPGLRSTWLENCIKERLLGVDLNGQMDCPAVQNGHVMASLKTIAVETNKYYAHKLGINQSASVTCVKPSGNSSQLLNSSSGLHSRWSPYYIRNVRISTHSPIFKVFKEAGVPMDVENGQSVNDATTYVVHFPVKSPDGAITNGSRTAIEQCEYWLLNKVNYTEHNPSCTITYKPDEVMDLAKWVYDHQDLIGGMAFLPLFDAKYNQMPYEEISQAHYEYLADTFPAIDFANIYLYEESDLTTAAQELACMSGLCEI